MSIRWNFEDESHLRRRSPTSFGSKRDKFIVLIPDSLYRTINRYRGNMEGLHGRAPSLTQAVGMLLAACPKKFEEAIG